MHKCMGQGVEAWATFGWPKLDIRSGWLGFGCREGGCSHVVTALGEQGKGVARCGLGQCQVQRAWAREGGVGARDGQRGKEQLLGIAEARLGVLEGGLRIQAVWGDGGGYVTFEPCFGAWFKRDALCKCNTSNLLL
ncbi:hypothetical protein PIB30_070057 [Stylosanthes scabra]|uniref:Uncharacterized protein n=1 Tax=Stylosanthes scabra TaxID=79078 RepID=A0ABU6QNE5_9FABA|nr:hypothetical protein [Stylosanthes scabra]